MTNIILTTEDFNKQLLEGLCEDEDSVNTSPCLISGDKLDNQFITLSCKHKFNYCPIFYEIKHQKEFTKLETCRLKRYQIKCPYCRNVQNGIIPFNKDYPDLKMDGVNWPPSRVSKNNECMAIIKSGKRKGDYCAKPCFDKLCNMHNRTSKSINGVTCMAVIKSGPRKGQTCGCTCRTTESKTLKLCKRHFKSKD